MRKSLVMALLLGVVGCTQESPPVGRRDDASIDANLDASSPACSGSEADVTALLARSCGLAGCHDAPSVLDLASPGVVGRLLQGSNTCLGRTLVIPGDAANSFLIEKLTSATPECGGLMPPSGALDAASIDCIRMFIDGMAMQADAGVDAPTDAFVTPSDASSGCLGTEVLCSGTCRNTQTDNANCGMCGRACPGTSTCNSGACTCSGSLALCGDACVDVTSSPTNCGMCGRACAASEVCSSGTCRTGACPGTTTNCSGACVDTSTSGTNCGMCGRACAAGQACVGGACSCSAGTTSCGGACVDTSTSATNCGMCGRACGAGQVCSAGACMCSGSAMLCSGACVDTSTSATNCGMCGRSCPSGTTCSGGTCGCGGTLSLCASACVDTTSDAANCGRCGNACTASSMCVGGTCMGCGPVSSLSTQVQPILTSSCASSMCHAGSRPAAGLSLSAGTSYTQLVNQPASGCSDGRLRVVPGRPDQSYLMNKLTGVGMCFGRQMPLMGASLSATQIDLVRAWICRGALND